MSDLVTINEIAERAGLHHKTVRKLLRAEQGPPILRVGPGKRAIRIRACDADLWILHGLRNFRQIEQGQ